jgi:hypothetical protein
MNIFSNLPSAVRAKTPEVTPQNSLKSFIWFLLAAPLDRSTAADFAETMLNSRRPFHQKLGRVITRLLPPAAISAQRQSETKTAELEAEAWHKCVTHGIHDCFSAQYALQLAREYKTKGAPLHDITKNYFDQPYSDESRDKYIEDIMVRKEEILKQLETKRDEVIQDACRPDDLSQREAKLVSALADGYSAFTEHLKKPLLRPLDSHASIFENMEELKKLSDPRSSNEIIAGLVRDSQDGKLSNSGDVEVLEARVRRRHMEHTQEAQNNVARLLGNSILSYHAQCGEPYGRNIVSTVAKTLQQDLQHAAESPLLEAVTHSQSILEEKGMVLPIIVTDKKVALNPDWLQLHASMSPDVGPDIQ